MNSLIKFCGLNATRQMRASFRPVQSIIWKSTDTNKPTDELEHIQIIETNEQNYFQNVKNSFDTLQKNRRGESLEEKRSRLMYQSRKRGTTENGILLSNFSADFLYKMSEQEMNDYDLIINNLHNEWDLYYWLTNAVPIPEELKSNKCLDLMKKYCLNEDRKSRFDQPDLASIK